MASLSHLVVGFAAARVHDGAFRWRTMVALGTFALLPDVDVNAFRFDVPYDAPFGHRGATHSICFALLAGIVAWLLTRRWRSTLALFAVVLSHPLLDALTDGGLGVALFWPLTDVRYFAPWTPIPVAPIGMGMLSARGAYVLLVEAAVSLPLLLMAHRLAARADKPPATAKTA
jgi:inner membrane protein